MTKPGKRGQQAKREGPGLGLVGKGVLVLCFQGLTEEGSEIYMVDRRVGGIVGKRCLIIVSRNPGIIISVIEKKLLNANILTDGWSSDPPCHASLQLPLSSNFKRIMEKDKKGHIENSG